jgi:AcrR family transcriptional regulator
MSLPPYARIAAEIREQISSGALRPGDRVPSTRQITERWGVAMATATKVLTALGQEGLVRAIPGVGTVVAGPSRRAPAGRATDPGHPRQPGLAGAAGPGGGTEAGAPGAGPAARGLPAGPAARGLPAGPGRAVARGAGGPEPVLTPERIVAAAIAVADAESLAGLSMRRVATELGAATMSLYRHVADKDTLVLRMIDTAFGECVFPLREPAPDGWRARLEFAARAMWATFRRHPWLAQAMSASRPQLLTSTLAGGEWILASLDGHGLDTATMMSTHITLFTYVRGSAVHLEVEADAEAVTGLNADEWMDTQVPSLRAMVEAGNLPTLARMIDHQYDYDQDAVFEFGLQRLLDGFAVLIDGPPRASGHVTSR